MPGCKPCLCQAWGCEWMTRQYVWPWALGLAPPSADHTSAAIADLRLTTLAHTASAADGVRGGIHAMQL